jgi:hypothetical protein
MSPPADATKKRSRVHGDVHGDAADSSTAATNEPVNETSNVDDNTVVRVDANPPRPVFASPVRPAKPPTHLHRLPRLLLLLLLPQLVRQRPFRHLGDVLHAT